MVKHRTRQPARFKTLVSRDSSPLFPRLAFSMICGSRPPKVMMRMVDAWKAAQMEHPQMRSSASIDCVLLRQQQLCRHPS